jgi:hypothetical protein
MIRSSCHADQQWWQRHAQRYNAHEVSCGHTSRRGIPTANHFRGVFMHDEPAGSFTDSLYIRTEAGALFRFSLQQRTR